MTNLTDEELADLVCDCVVCQVERCAKGVVEPTEAERMQARGELVTRKVKAAGISFADLLAKLPTPAPTPDTKARDLAKSTNFSKWPYTYEMLQREAFEQWAKLTPEQQDAAIKKVLGL